MGKIWRNTYIVDVINMNNRRQYQYVQTPQPYNIETISVSEGDVIILHLANNLDLDEINAISKDIAQYFPNNKVLCANENILKKISVVKQTQNPFLYIDLNGEWLK